MMPKMDGYKLIKEIRKSHTMPIIVVSGAYFGDKMSPL